MMMNYKDVVRNVMAREKALYEGHAVAAVAATSTAIARRALKLIEVKYEVLPHVIDVVEAMRPDAPLLHDDLFTVGVEPKPEKPSNIAKRIEIKQGDVEAGLAFKVSDHILVAHIENSARRQYEMPMGHQTLIMAIIARELAGLSTVSDRGDVFSSRLKFA
jgi:CO/xanthine dehydrogenase Mo-binding subunit